ncbi:MAG: heme o synthase [Anaerolineae bacterium]|nr:heme o synthase [Anaerolineae bacterium]MDW8098942.1 heme o synthase [Anaerolineae bacterium]
MSYFSTNLSGFAPIHRQSVLSVVRALFVLFKLRIVALLLFAAIGGAFLGADGWPGRGPLILILVTGGLAASGASALNEYLEREVDRRMRRTRHRPLITGVIPETAWVPALAVAMIVGPSLAVSPSHPALAFFLVLGAVIYVGVYTLWLKPRTALNIVIGGAAGSCAVLSGGAAVGAWSDPRVLALALLVFLWTPIHFWSLALVYRDDYARAGVPMLPVVTTPRWAAFWGLVHGAGAGLTGLALAFHPELGIVYLMPVLIITLYLLGQGIRLIIQPSARHAWRLFHASNLYLTVSLLAACADSVIRL